MCLYLELDSLQNTYRCYLCSGRCRYVLEDETQDAMEAKLTITTCILQVGQRPGIESPHYQRHQEDMIVCSDKLVCVEIRHSAIADDLWDHCNE